MSEQAIAQASKTLQNIRAEISKAVVGQQAVIDQILIALLAAGHTLIEGVPGLGKTLLVQALAKTIQGTFRRIQFTPDLMPGDITGHAMYDMKTEQFRIRKGPVFTHLLLADEINRAPAKTQAALLEVMQEQQVTIEARSFPVTAPFMTLATQNPIEQEGTYPLPEAQLDRFLFKVCMDYPQPEEEIQLLQQVTQSCSGESLDVSQVNAVIPPATVVKLQRTAAQVQVDSKIHEYVVQIVSNTRQWSGISNGAGPRGGIAMIRAARARALLNGHNFVTPDDVKAIVLPALRHRILLSPEWEIEGHDADAVLNNLLSQVSAPRD
ncbi:MoxR family ATPase [Candidatus Venteria ishoeyi]|uniref:AAA family ATPase n=1 Tax=Candidatus Venteria ishoeyi TaxID=1899563 RepID=UPI0025A5BB50|nr:MoxR family ATPase [Candidatus Venteria ishoeyi]MDM8548022.1 MoxR family ATPase [Candidatus Venteria ishoeyi]